MWKHEQTAVVTQKKAVVWNVWTTAERWPEWDTDLSEAALLGELAADVEGRMKVADDALVSFTVTEVIPEERFAYTTSLFGASITVTYEMHEDEAGLSVTHRAEIGGVFGFIWRLILAKKIARSLDAAFQNFLKQCEVVSEEMGREDAAKAAAAEKKEAAADASPAGEEQKPEEPETKPAEEEKEPEAVAEKEEAPAQESGPAEEKKEEAPADAPAEEKADLPTPPALPKASESAVEEKPAEPVAEQPAETETKAEEPKKEADAVPEASEGAEKKEEASEEKSDS